MSVHYMLVDKLCNPHTCEAHDTPSYTFRSYLIKYWLSESDPSKLLLTFPYLWGEFFYVFSEKKMRIVILQGCDHGLCTPPLSTLNGQWGVVSHMAYEGWPYSCYNYTCPFEFSRMKSQQSIRSRLIAEKTLWHRLTMCKNIWRTWGRQVSNMWLGDMKWYMPVKSVLVMGTPSISRHTNCASLGRHFIDYFALCVWMEYRVGMSIRFSSETPIKSIQSIIFS